MYASHRLPLPLYDPTSRGRSHSNRLHSLLQHPPRHPALDRAPVRKSAEVCLSEHHCRGSQGDALPVPVHRQVLEVEQVGCPRLDRDLLHHPLHPDRVRSSRRGCSLTLERFHPRLQTLHVSVGGSSQHRPLS